MASIKAAPSRKPPFRSSSQERIVDLDAEWRHAQGKQFTKTWLAALVCGLKIPLPFAVRLGVAAIRQSSAGLYEPIDGAPDSIIVPVREHGALVDLVAYRVGRRCWLRRTGYGAVLGFDCLDPSFGNDAPLRVFGGLLGWLRGSAVGIYVIDWSITKQLLPRDRLLVADSVAHRRELERRLTIRPDVRVAA